MRVHLNQIPQTGFLAIDAEIDAAKLDFGPCAPAAVSPLRCRLEVGVSGGGLFATGSLAMRFESECVACLRRFAYDVEVPDFATQVDLEGRESVDLTPQLREDILLVLPSHPRCDADGGQTCPAKFPRSPRPPLSDDPDAASPLWNALDKLHPKK